MCASQPQPPTPTPKPHPALMSSPASRSLPGLLVLWILEGLVAALWVYLLWWQRESTGLSFGLLGLGLCLVPLHGLRLLTPPRSWTWASFAWELLVLVLLRLGLASGLPLGYLLALALYAAFPADAQPAGHSWWRWLTRLPLALTLVSLFVLGCWPKPSWAAVPWLLLAAESELGPTPSPRLALARASGALTLLAIVSQVDLSVAMNQLVVLSFCYVALERYWRSDLRVLPRPSATSYAPVRLLALALYCYALPDPAAVRIGCAFFAAAGCFACWRHAPRRAARVAAALLLLLAGLELVAWQVRPDMSPLLSSTESRSSSLLDYLSRFGAPKVRDAGPALHILKFRGQDYEFEPRTGYRLDGGRPPFESSQAALGSSVVVLGDEAAFGLGVDENQHTSVRLADLLDSERAGNFGVIGVNFNEALGLARNLDAELEPDEIVWLLRSDDLLPDRYQVPYETDRAWSVPILRRLTAPAFERTHLGVLLSRPYDALLKHLDLRTDYLGNLVAPESEFCYAFATRMHDFCDLRRQQGRATPLVVVLPGYQAPPRQRTACLRLEIASEAAGARVIRIPGLADHARAWLDWSPQLPSAEGHALIAAALARELRP